MHSSGHPSPEGGGADAEEAARAPSVGEKADGQPDQGLQDIGVVGKADGEHLLITSCSRRASGQTEQAAPCTSPHLQRTWGRG